MRIVNLLDDLPTEINIHELRLLLDIRVGGPGQYESESTCRFHLPLAGKIAD
jgi:hypothetical protein